MNTSTLFDAIKMAEEAGLEAQIGICRDMLVLNAVEFSKTMPGRVIRQSGLGTTWQLRLSATR